MDVKLFENKNGCCGCWACANICPPKAIIMQPDNEGFLYPIIDEEKCIGCKSCLKVCPVKTATDRKNTENNKPHIGIINLQFAQNYGAVIAASVLENIVKNIVDNKYTVETINYGPSLTNGNDFQKRMDAIENVGGLKEYLKRRFVKGYKSDYAAAARTAKFKVFRDEFLNITKFHTDNTTIIGDKNYEAFIVGSDVVWQPKRVKSYRADGYFLKFANGQKTVSYAASIDSVVNLDLKKLSPYYKEGLKYIDCISTREKSSVPFLQGLTDKKVYECCDPAFLYSADQYDDMMGLAELSARNPKDKYIYVYALDDSTEPLEYAEKFAKEKGLKILYYSEAPYDFEVENEKCTDDGPAEFLCRLKNAEYVFTTSFHCIVFSLLFEKNFLSFARSKVSCKSTDLLEKYNLLDRIASSSTEISKIDEEIDFEKVREIINDGKERSLEFLKQSLQEFL